MTYPGGKAGSGVYQKIISLMPPHRVYIECFLGNGSIMRFKKPAERNIGVEIDSQVIGELWQGDEVPNLTILKEDVQSYLENLIYFNEKASYEDYLIYFDPPYLQSVRRSHRQIYRYEMSSETQHQKFLYEIRKLNQTRQCKIMISGYDSELYNRILPEWRKVSFTGISRAGATTEVVWLNFPEPLELHDYKFLGSDYRQREDIKRKKKRWINRLNKMQPQERYAFLSAFEELKTQLTPADVPGGPNRQI